MLAITTRPRRALLFALSLLPVATGGCDTPVAPYLGPTSDPIPELRIEPAEVILTVGQRVQLDAIILAPRAANSAIEWTSTDSETATVSADGTVEALAAGEATVIAVAGGVRGLAQVFVKGDGPSRPGRPPLK